MKLLTFHVLILLKGAGVNQLPFSVAYTIIHDLTKAAELVVELGCGQASFGIAAIFSNRDYIGIGSEADVVGAANTRLLIVHEDFKNRMGRAASE